MTTPPVQVQRPDAPRDTTSWSIEGPPGERLLTARMLLEIRRKVLVEIEQLRAYAAESHIDELRRVLHDAADRLDGIIGGAPT